MRLLYSTPLYANCIPTPHMTSDQATSACTVHTYQSHGLSRLYPSISLPCSLDFSSCPRILSTWRPYIFFESCVLSRKHVRRFVRTASGACTCAQYRRRFEKVWEMSAAYTRSWDAIPPPETQARYSICVLLSIGAPNGRSARNIFQSLLYSDEVALRLFLLNCFFECEKKYRSM